MSETLLIAVSAGAAILLAIGIFFYCRFWSRQGSKLSSESGYVTPYVSVLGRIALYLLSRLGAPYFFGCLHISGLQNMAGGKNGKLRYLVCPNHQFEHDVAVISYLIGTRRWRFLADIEQVRGRRAPWMAWLGVIPVETDSLRARVASMSSVVTALEREPGTSFIIFPQGRLVKDNNLTRKDFNTGPVIIAGRAAKATGDDFALLPMYIEYVTDPTRASLGQRLLAFCGIKREFCGRTVYGCRVQIAKPIPVKADEERSKDEIVDELFQAMTSMQNGT
ncbi:MAG: lysophospholipid acyltransferase family protein [Candidatus Obscuribacter sp.]|nr:lysophospholipid acyltransferase family protein [Candidatus Obscuribacter sp.]